MRMGSAADTAAATVPPPMSAVQAAFALALLLGLQPLATDVYLPALPQLARELAAPMPLAQLTMSALMLAFGSSQLFWGPLADRFGRRPVLLAGLALYTAAALGSTGAASIEVLIAWRALQGAALAAAVVCARAVLRDLYTPVQGAHVMLWAMSGLAVVAIGGPTLGGLVAAGVGWRGTLALVAALGLACGLYIAWRMPETLARRDPHATRLAPLARRWLAMLRHPVFRAWTLLAAASYGGLFTILAGTPFVYIDMLGLSAAHYGLALASGAAVYLGATFLGRRWVARHGMEGAVGRAAWFTLGAAVLALAALAMPAQLPALQLALLLGAHALYSLGHGLHQPCAQAGLVGPFPAAAGAASALAGFALALTAYAVGFWLGGSFDGTLVPYSSCLALLGALTVAVAWTLVRRLRA
jgi:DHA1 family bicyclomycin/chloramphenicol resistance-like MFS transporter